MNESEQAQAIEEILHRHDNTVLTWENETQPGDGRDAHNDRSTLLEIVDSQVQKSEKLLSENNVLAILVDELKADREAQAVRLEKVESLYAIARTQVEEQAREIERLKNENQR